MQVVLFHGRRPPQSKQGHREQRPPGEPNRRRVQRIPVRPPGGSTMRLVCAFLAALLLPATLPAAMQRPNILLIIADDLGYGELGCYGQKKIRTPQLDRLAREGLRFTQFYAGSPVCAPSRCCLMTGKHGGHAWVRNNREVKPEGQPPVPPAEVMLGELLKKQGYATGAMGKWGLGPPGTEADPIKRGFDLFFG